MIVPLDATGGWRFCHPLIHDAAYREPPRQRTGGASTPGSPIGSRPPSRPARVGRHRPSPGRRRRRRPGDPAPDPGSRAGAGPRRRRRGCCLFHRGRGSGAVGSSAAGAAGARPLEARAAVPVGRGARDSCRSAPRPARGRRNAPSTAASCIRGDRRRCGRGDLDRQTRPAGDRPRSLRARPVDPLLELRPEMDEDDPRRPGPVGHVDRLLGGQVAAARIVELRVGQRRLGDDDVRAPGRLDERVAGPVSPLIAIRAPSGPVTRQPQAGT